MTPKELALTGYYYASLPARWRLRRQLHLQRRAPLCVLFYHRIADTHPNDWSLSTSEFSRHMSWLQRHVDLVSLEEVQRRMRSGNAAPAASITFDDGYAENCDFAIPLLLRLKIPCTYFVSLDFIVNNRAFPHDVRAGQPLPANTIDQLRKMAAAGIEIGAHTRTHCDVGKIWDPRRLQDEVVTATAELADLIGKPVRYFAFPFGKPDNLSQQAADAAREAGIEAVCSAYGAYCLPGENPFHIQRIHGDPEFSRLRNWLTVDPRKLAIGRDFEFPEVPLLSPNERPVEKLLN